MNQSLMHRWIAGSFGTLSLLVLTFPKLARAELIRQNFEITVTGINRPSSEQLYPELNRLPVPAIGEKGRGSFTYDEAQINLINTPSSVPTGYYLGRPGSPALFDFSFNFFNRTYTQLTPTATRIGAFVIYDRTAAGKFQPRAMSLDATDDTSVARFIDDLFIYRPGAVNLPGDITAVNYARGTVEFTEAEVVPEPSAVGIVPLALGFVWLCNRKRRR